jgi:hypothetical protein
LANAGTVSLFAQKKNPAGVSLQGKIMIYIQLKRKRGTIGGLIKPGFSLLLTLSTLLEKCLDIPAKNYVYS